MQSDLSIHQIFQDAKLPVEQVANSWHRGRNRARLDKAQRRQRRYQRRRTMALRIISEKPDEPETLRVAHEFLAKQWSRVPKWAMRVGRADARDGKREERLAKARKAALQPREPLAEAWIANRKPVDLVAAVIEKARL